jgi:hypothetical protein
MGRYLITVEVEGWGGESEKDIRDYASTFGAEPGAQWDEPPATRIVSINVGAAAERLIASERADVLEGMGWPTVAGHVREGAPWGRVLAALAGADASGRATRLVQRWAEEDAKGGQS